MIKLYVNNTFFRPSLQKLIERLDYSYINSLDKFIDFFTACYSVEEIVDLIKQDISIIKLFKTQGRMDFILHLLFGTNKQVEWFDTDLFVQAAVYLNDKEIHFLCEIFSWYPDIFTDKETLHKAFQKKDYSHSKNLNFFTNYINYFDLSEEEENFIVGLLQKHRLAYRTDDFKLINCQYESSKKMLNAIIFANKLKAL